MCHLSDCAVYNEPAFRNEKCNCGYEENIKWLKNYLYILYKKEEITSDQLRDMSEIFSIKDDYDY